MSYHNYSKLNLFISLSDTVLHGQNVIFFFRFLEYTADTINLQIDSLIDWFGLIGMYFMLEPTRTSTSWSTAFTR